MNFPSPSCPVKPCMEDPGRGPYSNEGPYSLDIDTCRQGQSASMAGLDKLNNAKEAKTG